MFLSLQKILLKTTYWYYTEDEKLLKITEISVRFFGHWSGQNRIGGRVLAMKRWPNDEDTGWEILPATGGKMIQAGVT